MRLSIGTKIFIAFASVIVLFTLVLIFGLYRTQKTYGEVQTLNDTAVPLSLILSDAQTDLKSFSLVLNERDPLVLRRTLQVTRLGPSVPTRLRRKMERATTLAERADATQMSGPHAQPMQAAQTRIQTLRTEIDAFAVEAAGFTEFVLDEANADQGEEIETRQTKLRASARDLEVELTSLRKNLRSATDAGLAHANELERANVYALSIANVAALLVALGLLFGVGRTMRRLTLLTEAVKKIGAGDYARTELEVGGIGQDEIGVLTTEFNSMGRRLEERDQELRDQHAQLLKSERLATIGRMTSLITHELRNPLSSINLNTEMLMESLVGEETPEKDEALPLLETIISEVDRLRDITEEYLVYARLPSPKLEPHDVADLVHSLIDFHTWEWSQQDVAVEVALDEDSMAPIDPNQIRQAMLNLLRNAIEVSPPSSTVQVSGRADDGRVILEVRDEGPGIDEEVLAHIFEPFFTTKKSGTGLGLAMTQQVVEEHGGDIEVESDASGTTFRISLLA